MIPLQPTQVILDFNAENEAAAIENVVASLRNNTAIEDLAGFYHSIIERQKVSPPLMGGGIALPHARTKLVKEIVLAAGRCKQPVAFGKNAEPVSLIFVFGVPPQQVGEYLATVAALTRKLRDPLIREKLFEVTDPSLFCRMLV